MRSTLEFGVHEAIATFNNGNIVRCRLLEKLGIKPGSNCLKVMKLIDLRRIKEADKAIDELHKKIRQTQQITKRKLEDKYEEQEGPANLSYGAGMF